MAAGSSACAVLDELHPMIVYVVGGEGERDEPDDDGVEEGSVLDRLHLDRLVRLVRPR
jgi:hypothetical protein